MSKIKLLLVDDEEDYVKTMAERMEMRDVGSRVALSGEEALQMVEEDAPDVMVLDLRMPGINGMEVLERVKREHPHVQVIILTGHGSEKEEKEARRLGAFKYRQKPADTGDLLATLNGHQAGVSQVAWGPDGRLASNDYRGGVIAWDIGTGRSLFRDPGSSNRVRSLKWTGEGRLLYHIAEALRRLYRTPETFGICEECGETISFERLDALPHARLCITCKQREETGAA